MKIPWTKEQLNEQVRKAVGFYWRKRKAQSRNQSQKKVRDAGTRGEVTGGKQLNGFAKILFGIGKAAGFSEGEMFDGKDFPIPGYYRPQKNWDIVFVKNGKLVAVVELKSQGGSFGNNFNNRTEEVLGVSHDFWKAYREKAFKVPSAPWVGYFFLLESSPKSKRPVRIASRSSTLPAMKIFNDTSYMNRYEILCERLVRERDYSAAALLATTRRGEVEACRNKSLSFAGFCESLYRHLVAYS